MVVCIVCVVCLVSGTKFQKRKGLVNSSPSRSPTSDFIIVMQAQRRKQAAKRSSHSRLLIHRHSPTQTQVPILPHKHGEETTVRLVAAGQEGRGRIALARVRGKPSYGLGVFGTRRWQQCQQCQECVVVVKSRSRRRARYEWKRKGWENVPVERQAR